MSIPTLESHAQILKTLHRPGSPVVFANVWDAASAASLISLNDSSNAPLVTAVATASYAIAASIGKADADLTLDENLRAVQEISRIAQKANVPLSVDLQDGYGDRMVECIQRAIQAGAVGANIEDSYPERGYGAGTDCLRTADEQVERIKLALRTARDAGVPDFVINARTDIFRLSPAPEGWTAEDVLNDAVTRGKAYLEAGATCVFVWGGDTRGLTRQEIESLVEAFERRVAVKLSSRDDGLTVKELAEVGVCRISVGPSLWIEAMKAMRIAAQRILTGGGLA